MSLRSRPLDDRQLAVLRWVGDGCPDGPLAVPENKNRAQALANRGLVEVKRGKRGWRAVLTEAGRFYRDHGRYPEPPKPEPAETIDPPEGTGARSRPGRPRNVSASIRRRSFVGDGFGISEVAEEPVSGVGVECPPVCPAFPLQVPGRARGGRSVNSR